LEANVDDASIGKFKLDRRRLLGLGGAMSASVFLAACGRGGSAGTSGSRLTIGSIVPTLDAQFWQRYVAFMKGTAKALGVDIVTINANNSGDKLSRGIDDLVARKVDGLIFVPYFGAGPKGIASAQGANIPSMCVDTTPEDIQPGGQFKDYIGFVGPDDETAGYNMADALSKTIRPGSDGKKKIVAIEGTPGTSVAINRFKGLKRYISEKGDLVLQGSAVGNFVASESQSAMDDLLQRNPDTQGVWCANGGTATGAVASLENAGKTPGGDIKVVTMDLNPDNVERVAAGKIEFDTGGHWLQGGFSLIIMFDWLKGKRIADDQRSQIIKLLPVTKATLPQFKADYPSGLPEYKVREHSRFYTPNGPPAVIDLTYSKPVSLGLHP
jgi:ABC-type sugar transport system substrate-binding protein